MKSFSSAVLLLFVGCTFLNAPFARLTEAGEKSELRESLESIVRDDRWSRLDRLGPTVKPIVEAFKALAGRSKPGRAINLRCAPYTLGLLAGVNFEVDPRDLATEIDAAIDMYNALLPDLHATQAFAYVAGYVDGFGCKVWLAKEGVTQVRLLKGWQDRVDTIEGVFNGTEGGRDERGLWKMYEQGAPATLFPENVAKSGRLNYLQLQRERRYLKRDYFGVEESVAAKGGAGAAVARPKAEGPDEKLVGLKVTIRGAAAGAGAPAAVDRSESVAASSSAGYDREAVKAAAPRAAAKVVLDRVGGAAPGKAAALAGGSPAARRK